MSQANGQPEVIRIGRKGKRSFAIGDSDPFEIDVIVVSNQWLHVDAEFRDEKGEIPRLRLEEFNRAAWQFVRDLSGTADLTFSEALEFLARLTEESDKLRDFFVPRLREKQSSAESTELHFST